MLKIGVSSCYFYPDPTRAVFSKKTLCYLERDMAQYLSRKEVLPVLIPDLENEDHWNSFLSEMDGFVFQGGTDMSPKSYGKPPLNPKAWPGDFYRDQYELKIAQYAFENKKPMLGICRGLQLLNVFFGGTLYQDLATENPSAIQHRDPISYDQLSHKISFTPGGILENIYQSEIDSSKEDLFVNSVHHQSIQKLGKDLQVEAICPEDQTIEGISYQGEVDTFALGVQWHPEFSKTLKNLVIAPDKLFDKFLTYL